jgi:hypothetical protein
LGGTPPGEGPRHFVSTFVTLRVQHATTQGVLFFIFERNCETARAEKYLLIERAVLLRLLGFFPLRAQCDRYPPG